MKYKTTKKAIKELSNPVYSVGYCNLQYLLKFVEPFAYSTRAEGWACDYYEINGVIISTGYAPIGEKIDYELVNEYDNKACKICGNYSRSYEDRKAVVNTLLNEFINKVVVV